MITSKGIRGFGLALLLGLSSAGALAEGKLLGGKSSIRFISVKNAAVAEVHHFSGLTGSLNGEGFVSVDIPLATVETMVPIRNERMRQMLFEVATFPSAKVESTIDPDSVTSLGNGEYRTMQVLFRLSLHGRDEMMETEVEVARLGDELHVTTLKPLVLNAGSFGLSEGVERLRAVVGLDNISTAVPVMANLVFKVED